VVIIQFEYNRSLVLIRRNCKLYEVRIYHGSVQSDICSHGEVEDYLRGCLWNVNDTRSSPMNDTYVGLEWRDATLN
jgi:hypothetical protein